MKASDTNGKPVILVDTEIYLSEENYSCSKFHLSDKMKIVKSAEGAYAKSDFID